MQKRIWITRTLPSAHKSAANFAHLGFASAISPLLKIIPTPNMPPRPRDDDVLIFTSLNALHWFCEFTKLRHWPVVTVGDETAAQAQIAGFKDVSSASGTSKDVTQLVKSKFQASQSIIHCSGNHVRGTIIEDLQTAGYTARRDEYYKSIPVSNLPKIDFATLDYIALFSPLAAKTLANFKPDVATTTILSISQATDTALGNIQCQSRLIAKAPNETAMLALLGTSQTV